MVDSQLTVVIRIRGSMETRGEIEETLSTHMRLTRKFHCAVFSRDIKGWLQKAKDYITWGPIDDALYAELKQKRGKEGKRIFRLHPPNGGFKHSTKLPFPKGELGKRSGESMKKLLTRML